MRPGSYVRIIDIEDDSFTNVEHDDEAYARLAAFVGEVGKVVGVFLSHLGVGESPDDPAFIVEVPGLGRELFWSEELSASRRPRGLTAPAVRPVAKGDSA